MDTTYLFKSMQFRMPIHDPKQLDLFIDPQAKFLLLAGKSNVGKSSFINSIAPGRPAQVAKTPGKTKIPNLYEGVTQKQGKKVYLLDFPGFGHARVSKELLKQWGILIGEIYHVLAKQAVTLYILDARRSPQDSSDWIEHIENHSYGIVLNKVDKLKTQKERNALQLNLKNYRNLFPKALDIWPYSAIAKEKNGATLEHLATLLDQL